MTSVKPAAILRTVTSPTPRKPAIIDDVAREAGVSVPTVSRVLNGSAGVSDDKRARVEAAIRLLHYRPSAAARAMAGTQPKLIAILAGNTSQFGYAETIRGVEEGARRNGYSVSITVVESAATEHVERALDLVLNSPLAGIVVLKFDPPGVAALHAIPAGIPVVAVSGVREPGVPQAVLAEADAADDLITHLLELGHRTVHHVRVPPSRKEDGRTTGWRRALHRAGAPVPPMLDATWDPESGRAIGTRLAFDPQVTAVFCGNDEIAMGVMRGLYEAGRAVPDDVSVAGFDDHPLARMWCPPLTTVRQDFAELGTRAYGMLEDEIGGRHGRRFSSERPELRLRQSTAAPKTSGAGTRRAPAD